MSSGVVKSGGFRSFVEARRYVRNLGLKNWNEWYRFAASDARPGFIPSTPHRQYKDKWISMADWLGRPELEYLSFLKARALVRKLKFQNQLEFRTWVLENGFCKVPRSPRTVYRDKWKGWADFLGNRNFGKRGRKFRSFRSARAVARRLRLKGWKEWRGWAASDKRPIDIPARPEKIYRENGWVNVADWLGKGRFARARYVSRKKLG
jgi:hypothetical protein